MSLTMPRTADGQFQVHKWLFHQIDEIKDKMVMLEGKKATGDGDNIEPSQWVDLETFKMLEDKFDDMTRKWEAT